MGKKGLTKEEREKEAKNRTCRLCGERRGQYYIGGPVSCVCGRCIKIVDKFHKAKENQKRCWKQVNDADLTSLKNFIKKTVKDYPHSPQDYLLEVVNRVEEIQLQCAELVRVIHNGALSAQTDWEIREQHPHRLFRREKCSCKKFPCRAVDDDGKDVICPDYKYSPMGDD
jgi:hypothetical protein